MITKQTYRFDASFSKRDLAAILAPDTIANVLSLQCTDKQCKLPHIFLTMTYRISTSPRKRYHKKKS